MMRQPLTQFGSHVLLRYSIALYVFGVLFIVTVLYSNLDTYIFAKITEIIKPKYFYLIAYAAAIPCILYYKSILLSHPTNKFLIFLTIFFALIIGRAIMGDNIGSNTRLRGELISVALFAALFITFHDDKILFYARRVVLYILFFNIALNLFELFYQPSLGVSLALSVGLHRNPNIDALALNAGLPLAIGLLPPRVRLTFAIATFAAVFSTLSRSGMITSALITLVLWRTGVIVVTRSSIVSAAGVSAILLALFGAAYSGNSGFDLRNVFYAKIGHRVEALVAVVGGTQGQSRPPLEGRAPGAAAESDAQNSAALPIRDQSVPYRISRMKKALAAVLENPILGLGTDSWGRFGAHNAHLKYAVSFGLLGWLIVPGLALLLGLYGDRKITVPLAIVLLVEGFFTDNVLIYTPPIVALAIGAATCVGQRRRAAMIPGERKPRP